MQTSDLNSISSKAAVPRLLSVLTIMSVALGVSLIVIAALTVFVFKKKTESFAVTETGRVVPLVPLDKPYVNDSRVSGFAEECLRSSFAHDYENYRFTMGSAKNCYTAQGSKAFETAMDPMLEDIKVKRVVMSSSLEPTVVVKSYLLSGVVYWETQTPMTLYRRGTRDQLAPTRFLVTTVIERVPLDENVRGISVRSINLKPMSS